MATQAADVLRAGRPAPGTRMLFERWLEMIALTLLHEQQAGQGLRPGGQTPQAAPPRSLQRALDFIDAHAQADILLADIAAAASVRAPTPAHRPWPSPTTAASCTTG